VKFYRNAFVRLWAKKNAKKITEQFISVAVENNLNYSGSILHDFMRLAEIEISLRQIR
jgi:hypothetical protein